MPTKLSTITLNIGGHAYVMAHNRKEDKLALMVSLGDLREVPAHGMKFSCGVTLSRAILFDVIDAKLAKLN